MGISVRPFQGISIRPCSTRTLIRKALLSACTFLAASAAAADSFTWGSITNWTSDLSQTEKTSIIVPLGSGFYCDQNDDGELEDECVSVDIYFPRTSEKLRSKYQHSLPVVVLLQGALVSGQYYENVARGIALQNFLVAVPNVLRFVPGYGIAPFTAVGIEKETHAAIQDALGDSTSSLYEIGDLVDLETTGLIGHSFGAAMALYAIAGYCFPGLCTETLPITFDPINGDWQPNYESLAGLDGAAFFGASLADSIVEDIDTTGTSVAVLQGTMDQITDNADGQSAYQQLEADRAFMTVEGANHCAICDVDKPEGAQLDDDGPSTLDQMEANFHVARWMGLWLAAELKGDRRAKAWIDHVGGSWNGIVNVEELDRAE
jgi:dienelactone hydrolase